MSIISTSNQSSDWLYNNGFARRFKYEFSGVDNTPYTLKVTTSSNFKLLDRYIKPLSGNFRFQVLLNPDTEVDNGLATTVLNQPLNNRVIRDDFIEIRDVTITGGSVLDFDIFDATSKGNNPSSALPESDNQGRDFIAGSVFYLHITQESGNEDCSGIVEYRLAETP